jgi:hypothetical protein
MALNTITTMIGSSKRTEVKLLVNNITMLCPLNQCSNNSNNSNNPTKDKELLTKHKQLQEDRLKSEKKIEWLLEVSNL